MRAAARQDLFVHPLSCVRAARGWSYQDLVSVIARRVGNMAARREKAWRWEHWGVVPDLDSQRALAEVLGIGEEEIKLRPWPLWLPDGDPIRTSFGWTQAGSLDALRDALEHALMDRRGFMKITGATLLGLTEEWLNVEPAELVAVVRGSRVTSGFVDRIEAGIPRLDLLEATYGGGQARALLDAELGMVVQVLSKSSYSAEIGQRLHRLAAVLGRKAGWASLDAGLHAAAQRYCVSALYAAHAADDRVLGATVLQTMSYQCFDTGQPQEALALTQGARESARAAGSATGHITAMLALREARAHAALDDQAACDRLLSAAETAMSQAGSDDGDPAWMSYVVDAHFYLNAGISYASLRQSQRADDCLARAVSLLPETQVRDRANYLIRRAGVQIQLGDADHAHGLITDAIPLLAQAPSPRNLQRVLRVRDALPFPKTDPRAKALDDQLAPLLAA
jgi:tetratricopeptide (TPR) repeat protein